MKLVSSPLLAWAPFGWEPKKFAVLEFCLGKVLGRADFFKNGLFFQNRETRSYSGSSNKDSLLFLVLI